jgi:hypothetical protein
LRHQRTFYFIAFSDMAIAPLQIPVRKNPARVRNRRASSWAGLPSWLWIAALSGLILTAIGLILLAATR